MDTKLSIKIDWFTFVIHSDSIDPIEFWNDYFSDKLGQAIELKHGGRMYKNMFEALAGAKIYCNPVNLTQKHFCIELPGKAMDCISPGDIQQIGLLMKLEDNIRITRLDIAIDYCDFKPEYLWKYLKNGKVKTRANKTSFKFFEQPFQVNNDGSIGNSGFYVGSQNSERRVRCYSRHGFTRFEFQLRSDWATKLGQELLLTDYGNWLNLSMGFIDKYIKFPCKKWEEFVKCKIQRDIIVKSARKVSYEKLEKYLKNQVFPGLFTYKSIVGEEEFLYQLHLNIYNNPKRLEKWRSLLQLS